MAASNTPGALKIHLNSDIKIIFFDLMEIRVHHFIKTTKNVLIFSLQAAWRQLESTVNSGATKAPCIRPASLSL